MRRFAILFAVLLAACSGSHKASPLPSTTASTAAAETTTSSTATTETTVTTAPTATTNPANSVEIITFTSPSPTVIDCPAPTSIELRWKTKNARSIDLLIDNALFATFTSANFDGLQYLACDGKPHVYELVAKGVQGDRAVARLQFTGKPSAG